MEFYINATLDNIDLVVFPELSVTGYPILDLVFDQDFTNSLQQIILEICQKTKNYDTAILFGTPHYEEGKIYNAAYFVHMGEIKYVVKKTHLPNYSLFNEPRNFVSFLDKNLVIKFKNKKIGVLICEDMWFDDVAESFEEAVDFVIVINASPYDLEKHKERYKKATSIVKITKAPLIYLNLFGGQDDFVFDGGSFILNKDETYKLMPLQWREAIFDFDDEILLENFGNQYKFTDLESLYQALMVSVRDYISKNNFKNTLLGLSGGIDSALVAAIIADSVGGDTLKTIMLKSEFTSDESINYAKQIAYNIDSIYEVIDINQLFTQCKSQIYSLTKDLTVITQDNIQARARGLLLMAISNQENRLLIATSNKSESMMGYATLYGDMCGAFSLIKDLYKTQIYELSNWRNENIPFESKCYKKNIIPVEVITREPTAELRHNQKDSDSLPDYAVLDQILFLLNERNMSVNEISQLLNLDIDFIKDIKKKIYRHEFKRSQAAVGPKISIKSLNSERKFPITCGFFD
jgi:NAD+ synthase